MLPLLLMVSILTMPTDQPVDTNKTYLACGCGCCGDTGQKIQEKCVSNSAALNELKQANREFSRSHDCAVMGCSIGVRYRVCNSTKGFIQNAEDKMNGFWQNLRSIHLDF